MDTSGAAAADEVVDVEDVPTHAGGTTVVMLGLTLPNAAPHQGPFSLTWPLIPTKLPLLFRTPFIEASSQRLKMS